MKLDMREIPFSRYGSYFVFSVDLDTEKLLLRDVHGGDESPSNIFKIDVIKNGKAVPYKILANETKIKIIAENNVLEQINICISDDDMIHVEGKGIGLEFNAIKTKYDNIMKWCENKWEYHFYSKEIKMMFSLIKGGVKLDAPWDIVGNSSIKMNIEPDGEEYMHFVIESYKTVYKEKEFSEYEYAQKKVDECYKNWYISMNEVPKEYSKSKKLASYITWSCVVHPEGMLKRYAMYMSKNWMYNIWSWDNCFNAIMLSSNHPQLALDQLLLFKDCQDYSGVYPDFINDKYCSFSCCKPPIHAWAFKKMRKNNSLFNRKDVVKSIYESICKSTNYWLEYRRKDKNSLPVYNHGNDSGWDNASVFHMGIPVESPDLAAHLVRQMDILSEMALELNKKQEADMWKKQSDYIYKLLIEKLWKKDGFIAIYVSEKKEIPYKNSLLLRLPVVIGYRLPKNIMNNMIKSLKEDFSSDFGFTTESQNSEFYKENGYWLGPIWAPVMYLIIDALNSYGYSSIAKDYAKRFCNITLVGGMSENFNSSTGKGLDDPAFTWTSSVFLMLAKEYL